MGMRPKWMVGYAETDALPCERVLIADVLVDAEEGEAQTHEEKGRE